MRFGGFGAVTLPIAAFVVVSVLVLLPHSASAGPWDGYFTVLVTPPGELEDAVRVAQEAATRAESTERGADSTDSPSSRLEDEPGSKAGEGRLVDSPSVVHPGNVSVSVTTFAAMERVPLGDVEERLHVRDPRRDAYMERLPEAFRGRLDAEEAAVFYVSRAVGRASLNAAFAEAGLEAHVLGSRGGGSVPARTVLMVALAVGGALLLLAVGRRNRGESAMVLAATVPLMLTAPAAGLGCFAGWIVARERVLRRGIGFAEPGAELPAALGAALALTVLGREVLVALNAGNGELVGAAAVALAGMVGIPVLRRRHRRARRERSDHAIFEPIPLVVERQPSRLGPCLGILGGAVAVVALLGAVTPAAHEGGLRARAEVPTPLQPGTEPEDVRATEASASPRPATSHGAPSGAQSIRAAGADRAASEADAGSASHAVAALEPEPISELDLVDSLMSWDAESERVAPPGPPDPALYFAHRAYQEALAYGRAFAYPGPGEDVSVVRFEESDGRLAERRQVVLRFDEEWVSDVVREYEGLMHLWRAQENSSRVPGGQGAEEAERSDAQDAVGDPERTFALLAEAGYHELVFTVHHMLYDPEPPPGVPTGYAAGTLALLAGSAVAGARKTARGGVTGFTSSMPPVRAA